MTKRIAVRDRSLKIWTAGSVFTEIMVRSLLKAADKNVEIIVLSSHPEKWKGLTSSVKVSNPKKTIVKRAGKLIGIPEKSPQEIYCEKEDVSAMLLGAQFYPYRTSFKKIAWIYDFQHKVLPEYFTRNALANRDNTFEHLARCADIVLLSSKFEFEKYKTFFPQYINKARVISFPSLYSLVPTKKNINASNVKYRIPKKFILVANQYWAHKNHAVVIRALSILAQQGIKVPAVFTGLPIDHREPDNINVSLMLQEIASHGLSGQIVPLGLVPKPDLTELMRLATVIIQPSRYEGWSTVVQDAITLGRPVICSDIPVHHVQAPNALGFFGCDDPERLSELLNSLWGNLTPGPDIKAESTCIENQSAMAMKYGKDLLDICLT